MMIKFRCNTRWRMGNGKMTKGNGRWEIHFSFFFVCFRFAVYNEEQMVFLDIHVLFQKRSIFIVETVSMPL